MVSRYQYRGITWVDLESPTPSEVRGIMEEFDIHPLIGEELLTPSFKSKVDRHGDCLYIILHFPSFSTKITGEMVEVDFIVGKNFIVTTRYANLDPFLRFSKIFEAHSLLDRGDVTADAGYVFWYMLHNLYLALDGELESLGLRLNKIEDRMFMGKEREMVLELSRVSQALITFKQTLVPHESILASLETPGSRLFGASFSHHIKALRGEFDRLRSQFESEREMLADLRATNNSLLSTKENEIMKTLTIMAFTTFPLTLISSIFGMNARHTPIIGSFGDFWIIIGLMAGLTFSFFLFFKHKKWL